MNLIELVIWSIAGTLSICFAVGGYHLFGILGAVAGVVIGLLIGLAAGTGVTRRFYGAQRFKKRGKNI